MKPGSIECDIAYEKARDRAIDAYWEMHHHCPWCDCGSRDEETCTECGESMICPECGLSDLKWADGVTACGVQTNYRLCGDCGHQYDQQ